MTFKYMCLYLECRFKYNPGRRKSATAAITVTLRTTARIAACLGSFLPATKGTPRGVRPTMTTPTTIVVAVALLGRSVRQAKNTHWHSSS